MPSIPLKGPLCTRQSLTHELRDLGVKQGDVLLVHSSLSALGWVNGGAEAVVLAFLDAIGDNGTLAVPTFSSANSDLAEWENRPCPSSGGRPSARRCPRTTLVPLALTRWV